MKICADCKWYRLRTFGECEAPQNKSDINIVTGRASYQWIYCDTHRLKTWPWDILMGVCGRRGRWFEPEEKEASRES